MQTRLLASVFLIAMASTITTVPIQAVRAQTQTTSFVCGVSNGTPATLARTQRGDVPVIRWASNYFSGSGWTPERRCEEVSQRFQSYYDNGTLKYLTTGIMNGLPVICTAIQEGGACQDLLLTLRQDANPGQALQQLLAVRSRASSGPLSQSSERVYIDVEDYLQTAPLNNQESEMENTASPSNQGSAQQLW
jgi:hypothetical protein